jgi:hypothetical protein
LEQASLAKQIEAFVSGIKVIVKKLILCTEIDPSQWALLMIGRSTKEQTTIRQSLWTIIGWSIL